MRSGRPSADVAILGGGIVGAACAAALARDKVTVTLIEAGDGCGCNGATAAGMGHIVAMDDSEAQFALCCYSSRLWRAIEPDLPRQVEYEARGTLWIATDDEEMESVRGKHSFYQTHGVQSDVLDASALREAEPSLREGLAGALRVPGDSVIYAPCAAHWLASTAGVRLVRGEAAAVEPGCVRMMDGSAMPAGLVIIAAGTASARLTPGGLPVHPRKGHLAITDRYPGFLRHQLVELGYLKSAHEHAAESVAFNVQPRATGQVLIGSSRQYGVEHRAIELPLLARMLERAFVFLPQLAAMAVIRTWTGFRAATPDSLPLIGPVAEGVWVAAGHEGLGITTSLGTAQLIADRLAGRTPAIPAEPYLPSRFFGDFKHDRNHD